MASISMGREALRAAAFHTIRQHARRRLLHGSTRRLAPSNFAMPAMSPTMTEGNIAHWKVKEGDSFSAGDVLLEIETDKAQMDVEAQDEGVLAKIMVPEGSKAVKVGARIAVMAEPGDDLSQLEIPPDQSTTSTPAPSPATSSSTEDKSMASGPSTSTKKPDQPRDEPPSAAKRASQTTRRKYPLYPSVIQLLHEHGLQPSDADKIKATGPNGRLLKGDVLVYVGSVSESHIEQLESQISKLEHLDLSNIKVSPRKSDDDRQAPLPSASPANDSIPEPEATELAVTINFDAVKTVQRRMQEVLGTDITIDTFVSRAIQVSNANLPLSKGRAPSHEELFDDLVGQSNSRKASSRGSYQPSLTVLPEFSAASFQPKAEPDIIDVLSGPTHVRSSRAHIPMEGESFQETNVLHLTVPKGEEQRGKMFLERVKTILQVEPGRLVV